jgi:hypothetical protein
MTMKFETKWEKYFQLTTSTYFTFGSIFTWCSTRISSICHSFVCSSVSIDHMRQQSTFLFCFMCTALVVIHPCDIDRFVRAMFASVMFHKVDRTRKHAVFKTRSSVWLSCCIFTRLVGRHISILFDACKWFESFALSSSLSTWRDLSSAFHSRQWFHRNR